MPLIWAFILSIPKMISLTGQFFHLGYAIWKLLRHKTKLDRKAIMEALVAAAHKAVDQKDPRDLEALIERLVPE